MQSRNESGANFFGVWLEFLFQTMTWFKKAHPSDDREPISHAC